MSKKKKHTSYIATVVKCRCSRCREGRLFTYPLSLTFKNNMIMNRECGVCGQPTEIEVGFYYGTSYVSYALSIAISVASLIAWWLLIGLSIQDNRFFVWLGVNAVLLILLQPWLMRFSRSLWLSWFVRYDKNWSQSKPVNVSERMNQDQANNW